MSPIADGSVKTTWKEEIGSSSASRAAIHWRAAAPLHFGQCRLRQQLSENSANAVDKVSARRGRVDAGIDSALGSAGARLFFTPNWSLLAKFDGDFASGSRTHAGSGTLRYTW